MMTLCEREQKRALKIPDGKEDLSELMVLYQVRKEVWNWSEQNVLQNHTWSVFLYLTSARDN